MRNALLLVSAFLHLIPLTAQKPEYHRSHELQYMYTTRTYALQSTGRPYTGFIYNLNYMQNDTTHLSYYSKGMLNWSRDYTDYGKLIAKTDHYLQGFRNDSVCMEYVTFSQYTGDTTGYFVHYIDRNGVKWSVQRAYYGQFDQKKKPALMSVSKQRFFSRKDTKGFSGGNYSEPQRYDSAGYHTNSAETGLFVQYFESGKVMMIGTNARWEYCMSHQGAYPVYPSFGRSGIWTYYSYTDATKSKEEFYDRSGLLTETRTYFPNGTMESRQNYKTAFALLTPPCVDGITVSKRDSCMVSSTRWYNNGIKQSEMFTSPKGEIVSYAFHTNGRPMFCVANAADQRPMGIHKKWDEQGYITEFVNYSVEQNDTICYVARKGKIISLNTRKFREPINWQGMPGGMYYYNVQQTFMYLNERTAMHQEFYANGQIKREVMLRKGKRDGWYAEWDSTGVQTVKGYYSNGIKNGQWQEWYSNGNRKVEFYYRDGIRNGKCTEYYVFGTVKWENTYTYGIPGQAVAFSENGTPLKSGNYFESFYPAECIARQEVYLQPAALYYFVTEQKMETVAVTIPDSLLEPYAYKSVAVFSMLNPLYNVCGEPGINYSESEFDLYHSSFVISESAYNDSTKKIMNSFFSRHGIRIDSEQLMKNPILGMEKEYKISYSAMQILNKPVIIDSLDYYCIRNSADGKNGYILSLDSNIPASPVFGPGKKSHMTTGKGYTTFVVESGKPGVNSWPQYSSAEYIIYDDFSVELKSSSIQDSGQMYWPLQAR